MDAETEIKVPEVIAMRTGTLRPILRKWKKQNPNAEWSEFLRLGISESGTILGIAGKRHQHLLA